jgi:hypothetical protein
VPELHQNFIRHTLALNENLQVAQEECCAKQTAFAAVQSRVEQYLNQQHVFSDLQQQLHLKQINIMSDFQDQIVMDLAAGGRK